MLATNSTTTEIIRIERMREILHAEGPCITMFLPPCRPGEAKGSPGALIKANIQAATQELAKQHFSTSDAVELLKPLEDPTLEEASHWSRVILNSRDIIEQFRLSQPVDASLQIASCFAIRKLLPEMALPKAFYILNLSKAGVDLLRCEGLEIERVGLPAGVPAKLADFLAFDAPDHREENRSPSGASTGAMKGVPFGTGSERDRTKVYLADFYKNVDRGIKKLLGDQGMPFILAGVDQETSIYRHISTSPNLLSEAIRGSRDLDRDQATILQEAYGILLADQRESQAAALLSAHERNARDRFSNDFDTIIRAAFEGRVAQLYLNESAEKIGVFRRDKFRTLGQEDLLNLAAVQTILHKGDAYSLPAEMIPGGAIAAAVLRY